MTGTVRRQGLPSGALESHAGTALSASSAWRMSARSRP